MSALKQSSISPLEAHVGYWLRFVSNHVSHAFSRKVEACGVTVAEWVLLRELFECDGMAPSELAQRLGMTRGAISKLIDRLVGKALVAKTAGERDRRYQSVALTKEGRKLVPELAALADRNDEEFFNGLSAVERETLMRLMKKIVRTHGFKEIPTD
ncbi:MAG TPA: MarR family transcriptional regulator [Ferrovibrio sp.]|uniref:MarR family winged helix-turn-helix transcriptional regulator n=1 Tax=Ferrovibrio sp. TaxID=1917215 RepID=UPI002ED1C6D6